MENVAEYKEIVEVIKLSGGDVFKYCYQCGTCDTLCPWNRVIQFSMRKIVRQACFGMTEIETEDIWRCTTCGRCHYRCPRGVKLIDLTVSLRKIGSEYGVFPEHVKPVKSANASLVAEGNPLSEERKKRAEWAKGLGVQEFDEEKEILYFPGCYLCYDPRMKKVAKATAELLNMSGVEYGILGEKENCCGESIRKTGDEELFKQLAKENIKAFIDSGVKRVLVSSPHCYHTFKNEYPEYFMVNFEIIHMSQFLFDLIEKGLLKITKEYNKKVTYHDPCYLGRHNGIYDEPREILKKVPGLELVEMPDNREDSLCCGGGGGRVWMETVKGERFSDLRIQQALDVGAEVIVTCCPYCITMLEDSKKTIEDPRAESLEIKDITELLREVV
ncbi:MAG: Fe-S oxidoreductase [Deltaproteobacteria bacterium]|nr:MAG: Fe-S oxidoreductase [Deltaproteobacteria bacterium]